MTTSSLSAKKIWLLFLVSFLSLYFELLVIRWLSSQIRIFAYFKNVPLLASVFGLGLGLALVSSKRDFSRWFPISMLVLVVLMAFAEPLNLVHISFMNSAEFYLLGVNNGGFMDVSIPQKIGLILYGLVVLLGVFYLIVLMFLGIGQRLGAAFEGFKPLVAYSINIGGSLLAIICFSLLSYFSLKPEIWLLLGCLLALPLYLRDWKQIAILAAGVAVAFAGSAPNVYWSPYYEIQVEKQFIAKTDEQHPDFLYGYLVKVNHDAIEGAYDNRPETLAKLSPKQKDQILDFYDMLYQLIGNQPKSMLILAAGAGNDMAAALRHGATDIDAVEIDPMICELGKKLHVERPYDNPAVHSIIDDARAYMHRSQKKYDVVDYAYLDSHTAFSSMSSIRLDNYIYTVESFKDALKLMKPNGILACTFYPTTAWQQVRIFKTMSEALGYEPVGVLSHTGTGLSFIAGPTPELYKERALKAGLKLFSRADYEKMMVSELATWDSINPTTDDWPFLFLRQRGLALSYAGGLLFTLLIGWRLVGRTFGKFSTEPIGLNMFFLGAAFMLIEVKSMSQMGLIVGTTWVVNAAVIGAIMVMILFANIGQIYLKLRRVDFLYYGLFASLLISYFTSLALLNTLPMEARICVGGLLLALPLFFASWIFAITFTNVEDPQRALGMNLLGTLVGGALEYASMIFGISALNLVALILYGLAFYYDKKVRKASAASS